MSSSRLVSSLRFFAPILFIAASFAWGLQGAMQWFLRHETPSIRVDADTVLLADAVASHPHLAQTWDWWSGPWYAAVPYFRPLSMMGFWAQVRLFGDRNLLAFEALHWAYHGLILVLLFGFFSPIAGRGRAALAVGMFAAGANVYAEQITGLDAFNCWKDSADVWHLGFFTLSAWSFLAFLRRDKRRFLIASLLFWLCAVAVKESGYCLPFMLPVLLWHEKKWRTKWRSAAIFFALAPLLWAYRWHALGGWGNRTGSNGSWRQRVAVDALGLPGQVFNGDTLALSLLFAAFLLIWLWPVRECGERRIAVPLLWLGALTAAALWQAMRWSQNSLFDTLMLFSMPAIWPTVLSSALMLTLYLQFVMRRDRAQIFAVGWIAVTFIPLAMQPPTSSHLHYPVAPGWSLFLSCALWALPSSLKSVALWLKPVPNGEVQTSNAL